MGIDVDNIIRSLPTARRISTRLNAGINNDPQRNYMWEFSILGRELNATFLNDLRFYAKTVTIPTQSVELIPIKYMGNTIHYSGQESSPKTLQVTFWDDENLTVYSYLKSWHELTREVYTGRAVSPRNMSTDLVVTLKDHTDFVKTAKFIFKNSFIFEIGEIPLNYDGSEAIEIQASFIYQEMENEV